MAVIYFFKDSLTRSNVDKIEIKAGTTLQEFLDSRAISANEISAADKKGEISDPGDYIFGPDSCVILTPNLGKNAGKVFKAILGVALLAATGGTAGLLAGLFGGGATGALIVKGLGAALLMDGGGELMMGKMKLGSIDVANETTPQSYTWNVGSLSNSRGLMGLTFGSGVMPEGELLAYRTFGTNTVTTQTHQQLQAYNTWTKQWNDVSRAYNGQKTRTLTIKDNRTVEDDTSVLEMLIGCGEGPLDRIYDIKVNGTPLSELGSDVVCETRLGTNSQSSFGGLVDIDSQLGSLSVGQQVKRSGESDGWSIYTAPVSGNKVKLSLSSNAFYLMDLQSGSKNQAYASLRVEWREADTLNAWTSAGVSGLPATDLPMLSKQPFYINVTIDVGAAAKKIEIRILNDSDQLNLNKGWLSQAEYTQLPDRAQINFMLQNISVFSADERSYPGIGLIYLRIPASQALNGGIPKVSWKQDRANIIAWNGSAYVSRPADNIAWKIYDIICKIRKDEYTNQYHGLGWPVSLVDFSRFEQFAAFCDSINAKGNDFLKKSGAAWDIVQEYATSGRGYISHRMGLIAPYWDAAGQITQIFTSGNMSANSVEGGYALPKERATALNITFNDEANDFRESTVRITADAADDGSEASTVCFPGLSTVAAASAQARYHLRRNRYIRHNISFKAAWDSLVSEVGDIIGIQSDITEWGSGGRILSIDSANTALQLSEPVTMRSGQTYGLLVRKVTGVLGTLEPSHVWVNGQWVTPSAAGTTGDRIKVDTIAGVTVDDVYSFGARNYETKPFRISTISRSVKDGKAVIHAVEYNPALYVDGGSAPIIDYRQQNAGISSLVALTDNADGSIGLAWQPTENTKATQVWVNDRYIANVAGSTFVLPTLSDTQNVKLIPVLSDGTPGEPVTQIINPNITAPAAPALPLVSPTSTGTLLTFTDLPQNQGLAYITVEEGGAEIARTVVQGGTVTFVLPLGGGNHILSAFAINAFGLKSLPTEFTVAPLGIDSALFGNKSIQLPTGSILNLNAKGSTTASIKEANGVIDGSGYGHHGRADNTVAISNDVDFGPCFNFAGAGGITMPNLDISEGMTYVFKVKNLGVNEGTSYSQIFRHYKTSNGIIVRIRPANSAADIQIYNNSSSALTLNVAIPSDVSILEFAFAVDSSGSAIYINGEKKAESTAVKLLAAITDVPLTINKTSTKPGLFSEFRIYPRRLNDVEVKSLRLIPQEIVLNRVTADFLAANSVTANAVGSNQVITSAANIKDATITDAKISGTLGANRIAANSITAEKVRVNGLSEPRQCKLHWSASQFESGSQAIPDSSNNNHPAKGNASFGLENSNPDIGAYFNFVPSSSRFFDSNYAPMPANGSIKSVTLSAWVAINKPPASDLARTLYIGQGNSYCGWGLTIFNQQLCVEIRPNSGTTTYAVTIPYTWATWAHIVCRINTVNNTIRAYQNGTFVGTASYTPATLGPYSNFRVGWPNFIGGSGSPSITQAFRFADVRVYERALSDDEIMTLYKLGTDTESGQITTDRLATDAVKSRNYSYSSGDFSTAGTFLDLANGAITSQNFCIKNDGSAVFKGSLSSGNFTLNPAKSSFSHTNVWVNIGPGSQLKDYVYVRLYVESELGAGFISVYGGVGDNGWGTPGASIDTGWATSMTVKFGGDASKNCYIGLISSSRGIKVSVAEASAKCSNFTFSSTAPATVYSYTESLYRGSQICYSDDHYRLWSDGFKEYYGYMNSVSFDVPFSEVPKGGVIPIDGNHVYVTSLTKSGATFNRTCRFYFCGI